MARKKAKSKGGSCAVKTISFMAKGHRVTFRGRPGGMKSAGGVCPNKHRSTAKLAPFKKQFAAAVKACAHASHKRHGKHGASPFNRCVGQKVG